MKMYKIHLYEPWLSRIREGSKTIEGRLKKGKYEKVEKGDTLVVFSTGEIEQYSLKVKDVREYENFKDMILGEGIENVVSKSISLKEAIEGYNSIYTKEQQKKYKALAIEVKRIDR